MGSLVPWGNSNPWPPPNKPLRYSCNERRKPWALVGTQRLVRQYPGQYPRCMTRALAEVFSQLSSLPPVEQDRIAGWLQAELVSEEGWAHRFAQSQDVLNALADEAASDEAAFYEIGNSGGRTSKEPRAEATACICRS